MGQSSTPKYPSTTEATHLEPVLCALCSTRSLIQPRTTTPSRFTSSKTRTRTKLEARKMLKRVPLSAREARYQTRSRLALAALMPIPSHSHTGGRAGPQQTKIAKQELMTHLTRHYSILSK